MANFLEDLGRHIAEVIINQRLSIPGGDVASVKVDAEKYMVEANAKFGENALPPTQAQIYAADKAVIDYTLGRIKKQLTPHH